MIRVALTVHSGPWLRSEIVAPRGLTVSRLANHLAMSRQAVSNLLNGKASLSADDAIKFEKLFGVKADTLAHMQTAHDLANARRHEAKLNVRQLETV